MSASPGCPDRAAVETLSGDVRSGPVVGCDTRVVDCRPVDFLTIEIDGHTLEVRADEATLP